MAETALKVLQVSCRRRIRAERERHARYLKAIKEMAQTLGVLPDQVDTSNPLHDITDEVMNRTHRTLEEVLERHADVMLRRSGDHDHSPEPLLVEYRDGVPVTVVDTEHGGDNGDDNGDDNSDDNSSFSGDSDDGDEDNDTEWATSQPMAASQPERPSNLLDVIMGHASGRVYASRR